MSILPAAAKTLSGGVVYTVESAREAAFEGIEYEISMEPFKKYMKDPGFIAAAKTEGGKPRVSKRGRLLTFYSEGSYSTFYKKNSNYTYFYDNHGNLQYVGVRLKKNNNNNYPILGKKYDLNGKLIAVFFDVSAVESFVYTPAKKLVAHWIGDKCYDSHGDVLYLRKSNY